ncbi:hypothetical protein D3C71_1403750 [compost metagenome]
MARQCFRRPLVQRRTVQPDGALERPPETDKQARKRTLARSARADHAKTAAGLECEGDVLQDRLCRFGRKGANTLDGQKGLWRRQIEAHGGIRQQRQRSFKAMTALPGGDEALPVGNGKIDRRKRPRRQDGTGDDDAGCRLLIDDQPGPDGQNA